MNTFNNYICDPCNRPFFKYETKKIYNLPEIIAKIGL